MHDAWNPAQYERFRDERAQPFYDLLALVQPEPDITVVDLGCGSGKLTREMHVKLRAASTQGIDTSTAMLDQAKSIEEPGLTFERGDIASFAAPDGAFDLIFSNAAVHWVDDHPALLARLARMLRARGQLAIQMPANDDHPTHLIAAQVAQRPTFSSALGGYARTWPVLKPEAYAQLLNDLGFADQHVRLQVYPHRLASRGDVIEWVKGTLLTDYQKRMPADVFERFLVEYREALLPRLSEAQPFFYPFKRILFWARRGE